MSDEWKSFEMRSRVVAQIDEAMGHRPSQGKTAAELEETLFQRSEKREDYIKLVSRIMVFFDQSQNPQNRAQNQNPPQMSAMLSSGQPMTQVGAGGRPMMMNNPGMSLGPQQMNMPRGPHMAISSLPTNQGNDMIAWQTSNRQHMPMNIPQNKGQMQTMAQGKMTMAGQGTLMNSATGQIVNIPGPMGRAALQQTRVMSPSTVFNENMAGGSRQNVPTPTSISAQASHSMNNPGSQTSPAFIPPSSTMALSPAGGGVAGQVGNRGNMMGAPSPSNSGMINTPLQMGEQQQSPAADLLMNPVDAEYRDKVKQLQRYVVPLKKMIENGSIGSDKATKMKKLLHTLQNPDIKVPMETLIKCENVLNKLEIPKESKSEIEVAITSLQDSITLAHKSPKGAHIINKTLAPALNVLLGPPLPPPPKRIKRKEPIPSMPENGPIISNVVQGEVARLSQRFKVNLDYQQPPGSDDLTLVCHLDDPNLPCVPAITLILPSNYPKHPPKTCLSSIDYNTTDFLKKVHEIMTCRLHNLPSSGTISMILDLWEMSIRQACSPKPFNADAVSPLFALVNC